MAKHKYLSEVTIKLSVTEDGRFKGHIVDPDGDHTVTIANKSRSAAITHAFSEAREILKSNTLKEFVQRESRSGD